MENQSLQREQRLDESFVLRLVLGLFVFGTLAFGLMLWVCKGYYDEWVLFKSNAKIKSERNDERDKDSKKKKVKPSSSCGSGSDKRGSQACQDSQASSDDCGQARTSKSTRKRIQKIDLNASDVDNMENARSGILKQSASTNVAQKSSTTKVNSSAPAAKATGSGIKTAPSSDDQSQLVLPKFLIFDTNQSFNSSASTIVNQASTIVNTSNTLKAEELNRFNPAESKMTSIFPTQTTNQAMSKRLHQSINTSQCMSAYQNQVQTPVTNPNINGKIMARKQDVNDGKKSIDDWVDSMKAYIEGTNPGLVMDRV